MAALAEADARLLWMSARGHVLVLQVATPDLIRALYRDGATLVVAAAPLAGCLPTGIAASPITGAYQP